jgi:pimeloyl-ACP methyl ester carboxylesterase
MTLNSQTVASFDGTPLAVHSLGAPSSQPLLLVHGFLSSAIMNWVTPGIAFRLSQVGYLVIMPDLRGHGQSAAPEAAEAFPPDVLAKDMLAVIQALGLNNPALIGYSLGARTVVRMALLATMSATQAPPPALVLGGMGYQGLLDATPRRDWFIKTIQTRAMPHDPKSPEASVIRFLKQTGTNPHAAMHVLRSQVNNSVEDLTRLRQPTLVIAGVQDHDNGSAFDLAEKLPNARFIETPGTHMNAIGHPIFADALIEFLELNLRTLTKRPI